jgi:5-methylthioadenosine/S-adenosylhomocysteine deaminase
MEGASVLTLGSNAKVFDPGQVTWEDGTLVSVGAEDSDPSPVDQVIRVSDAYLLPGLLNGHNHAAMALMRGLADDSGLFEWLEGHIFPIEAKLTADDVYTGTLLACAEMIRSGTVGFADMYFHVDAVARAVDHSGLRAWIARGITGDLDSGRESLADGVAFAERWRDNPRITPMLGPHAPYTVSEDLLQATAAAAKSHQLGIHIHLAESRAEMDQLAKQSSTPFSIARRAGLFENRTLIAHGTQISVRDLPEIEGLVGGIIACPVSNAKLGNGILPYPLLKDANIAVGLGTDGPASTNSLDMFLEMKAMAWFQKVLAGEPQIFRAEEALNLATAGTARVLGHPGGELRPGLPADFIVVQKQVPHMVPDHDEVANLVYAASGQDVRYTVVDGRIIMAEGIITAFDDREVIREALERAHHLTE